MQPPILTDEYIDDLVQSAIEQATTHLHQGHFDLAESLLNQVQRLGRTSDHVTHLLALTLHRQNRNSEAAELISELCNKDNENWEYHNTYGCIASGLSNHKMAIECFKLAIESDPEEIMPRSNLALEYHSIGEYNEAKKCLKEAIKIDHGQEGTLWFNLGNIYFDEQMPETASQCFAKTKERLPEFHAADWNRASSLLMVGRYEEGWEAYESRWSVFANFAETRVHLNGIADWMGEPLDGKTIIVYCEQGSGDAIQFLRFVRNLKNQGAKVILDWRQTSVRGDLSYVLKTVDWIDEVIDVAKTGVGSQTIDYKVSIMSLPYVLKLYSDGDMKCDPYLTHPSLSTMDVSMDRYRDDFKIGVCWAGSPQHHKDSQRSCHLSCFKHLYYNIGGEPGGNIRLFNLQQDMRNRFWPGVGEVNLAEGISETPFTELPVILSDYMTTANIISNLDLVITVDTSIAHLAGAMGKRTFLLLPLTPDWRWGLKTTQTHWYPSVRLFRQPTRGGWNKVFEEATIATKALYDHLFGST